MDMKFDPSEYAADPALAPLGKSLEYLMEDFVGNVSILEEVRLGRAEVLEEDSGCAMVFHKCVKACMISARDPERAAECVEKAGTDFITVNSHEAERLAEAEGYIADDPCVQAAYLRPSVSLAEGPWDIRRLTYEEHFPVLERTYDGLPPELTAERLRKGMVYGLFEGGSLKGYIGSHEEGSIGMLYVFPEERHKGYARVLEEFMISKKLSEGVIPFAQILEDNVSSLSLQKNIGMELSRGRVIWMERSGSRS
ncbi:MAG: GNAT family N-acetyltransferase [Oscillospiraceae bacterium]|jgi:GNAT superfamily N-acetyltransferase